MAGQQFQYDDSGNTFFYFLTSFVGLIVVPATYYLWPRDQNAEQLRLKSLRRVHGRCLWYRLRLMKSQQSIVPTLKKAALLFGWAVFLLLAYKVSKLDREYQEYNPYEVLNLDPGASLSEIKKQYRVLSLKYHPDKGGDESTFMRIAKAYAALTNEQSRQNWETYGNPDGPGATSFGIALPAWIVDQKNSMLVLLVYGLAFMVILPVVVGTWWYRSIRYSGDQILINTTQLFMHFMYKTPNMNMKRLAMVLTAAFEFDPRSNKDATIRPTDNIEVPQLIRELGNINVKKKEPPFCYPYSLKARVLVLAHLARMDVSEELEEDQRFVVRKSPALLQEMINVGCQLTMMANSRGGFHAPRLVTIENCMKLTQMIVQGLQESKSPLLQLPHFEEEHLRYCISKKYKVRSLQDLVSLKDSDRRSMLRFLGEDKYDEVLAVLGSFPHIAMVTKLQVLDDEDSNNITAGSIVTVTVTLTRKRMAEVFEKEQDSSPCLTEEAATTEEAGDASKTKTKVWQNKSKAAKKTPKSKKKKITKKKAPPAPAKTKQANGNVAGSEVVAATASASAAAAATTTTTTTTAATTTTTTTTAAVVVKEEEEEASDKGSESDEAEAEANKDSPSERDEDSDKQSDTEVDEMAGDDEEEWEALQQSIQRRERALLETKSKVTHPVYSLYFPEEKHEWWWLYIADRRDQTLVSMPYHVCTLKDTEEVELKFPAPSKTGNYQYSIILRSDSYLGLDQIRPLKLEVHEAKAMLDNHPQWDIPDTEEEDEEQEDSDGIEESEDDEEDND
ncbi:translocation protein SEC63 homolog isoform X2 [Cyclopterus lumpus]|uniref:translocation protein SEC63 homolog isoform X2 n=1 Tax=Cyclopterus lumpus TaxID=8103 RepID=UPI001486DE85|nr:translocation protein SEC63 homolog isoform X2 [Cyclopterus lumpus]